MWRPITQIKRKNHSNQRIKKNKGDASNYYITSTQCTLQLMCHSRTDTQQEMWKDLIIPCSVVKWCTKYLASIPRERNAGDTPWMCTFKTTQALTSPDTPNLKDELRQIKLSNKFHYNISTLNKQKETHLIGIV